MQAAGGIQQDVYKRQAQIGENVRDYSKYLNIRSLVVFGGVSINPQMMKLRGGVDVLVATPGRLLLSLIHI